MFWGLDFASWIAKLSNRICHVVYTEYRPTPLVHYIFPGGEKSIYQVVDVKGNFRQDNFQKAISRITQASGKGRNKEKEKKMSKEDKAGLAVMNLVKMLVQKGSDPIIVFAFSRKACESYATKLMKLDMCNETEKALITKVFNSAMDSLTAEDKQLPQVLLINNLFFWILLAFSFGKNAMFTPNRFCKVKRCGPSDFELLLSCWHPHIKSPIIISFFTSENECLKVCKRTVISFIFLSWV